MHSKRQELLGSANRRVRRARTTTERIVVSALGFGVAYYFDVENGGARRAKLRQVLRQSARRVDAALASPVGDPPPDLPRALRGIGNHGPASRTAETVRGAAR